MGREQNPKVKEARALFLSGKKLIEIAKALDLPEGTVRRWKSVYQWGSEQNERSEKKKANVRKRGAQPGNQNATGPPGNKNAEKHGLFSKYLPEETLELVDAANGMDSLDLLWHQITIQYAAIIRAQKIMYVKDDKDKTVEKVSNQSGKIIGEKWEVQQAWDKQANFLQAQARAMTSLSNMIKNYEDLLHKNWEAATEEQKARIENIKAGTAKLKGEETGEQREDDGFLKALKGEAADVWQE